MPAPPIGRLLVEKTDVNQNYVTTEGQLIIFKLLVEEAVSEINPKRHFVRVEADNNDRIVACTIALCITILVESAGSRIVRR